MTRVRDMTRGRGKALAATRRMALSAGLCGLALAGVAGQAAACSILPPPMPPALAPMIDEPREAFEARQALHFDGFSALQEKKRRDEQRIRQEGLWDGAAAVVVVEVVSAKTDVSIMDGMGRGNAVRVKPVSWLKGGAKGKARSAPFDLTHVSYTSCGPTPSWRVLWGQPGERFVVFSQTGALAQEGLSDGVPAADIIDPRIVSALAAKVR